MAGALTYPFSQYWREIVDTFSQANPEASEVRLTVQEFAELASRLRISFDPELLAKALAMAGLVERQSGHLVLRIRDLTATATIGEKPIAEFQSESEAKAFLDLCWRLLEQPGSLNFKEVINQWNQNPIQPENFSGFIFSKKSIQIILLTESHFFA